MAHDTLHLELAPNVRGTINLDAGTLGQWVTELTRLDYQKFPDGVWRKRAPRTDSRLYSEFEPELPGLLRNPRFAVNPLDEQWVRPDMMEAIDGWVSGTHPFPGDFLTALLEGRLEDALGRADLYNQHTFPALVAYVYNKVPMGAKGRNFQAHKERVMVLAKERSKG